MNAVPPGEPGRDLDAEALSRVLDGLELDADADDTERAAQTRAQDDVAAIMRAFAVMGDALAAPAAPAPVDAVVLPFTARLRKRAPILAAAASMVAVVGLGAVLVNNNDLGGSQDDSSTAAQAPGDAAAAAPESAYRADGRNSDEESANALEAPASEAAPAADAAAAKAATSADAPRAPEPATQVAGEAEATTGASTKMSSPAKKDSVDPLVAAVTCSRGVLIGRVASVESVGEKFRLTLLVTDWVSPSTGPVTKTFLVGERYALTDDGRINLTTGQEFLFVIPASETKAVRAFTGPDYTEAKKRVAAAQDEADDSNC